MGFWNRQAKQEQEEGEEQPVNVQAPLQQPLQGLHQLHQNLAVSFSKVKDDISNQSQWLGYLHAAHKAIKEQHEVHAKETKQHLSKMYQWNNQLQQHTQKQQKDIKSIEQSLKETVKLYNDHILTLYNKQQELETATENVKHAFQNMLQQHKEELKVAMQKSMAVDMQNTVSAAFDLEWNHRELVLSKRLKTHVEDQFANLKQDIHNTVTAHLEKHKATLKEELSKELSQHVQLQSQQKHLPQQSEQEQQEQPMQIINKQHLTNPEINLLNFLFNEHDPLNYFQVASKTGHSINTVRVNMNLLKKKGFVEEHTLPSGVKLFNLTNKEKIKKMYNLEMVH